MQIYICIYIYCCCCYCMMLFFFMCHYVCTITDKQKK